MDVILRAAWCLVLGLEESDISDSSNFFTEGGDSVTAMRLISAARDRNVALDTETIFNHPVLVDMANLCRPMEPDKDSEVDPRPVELDGGVVKACAEACGVQRDLIEDVIPPTDFQCYQFHQHIASGSFMIQTVFEISGAFDLDLLRQTWQVLHDKNQILRTRLVKHNDEILQVVVNDTIQWGGGCGLADYKASDIDKRVGSGDPLFRYAIVTEGDRSFFVWTCHHAGFDGWTRRLIMDKLQKGHSDPTELRSEPNGPTFRSFVEWSASQSDNKSKAAAFWKQYLAGYRLLESIQPPTPDYVILSSSQFSRTIEMKKTAGTNSPFTLSTIGHAAWAVAVGSLWNVADVLFATVKMGRQMARDSALARVESIMGPMMAVSSVRVGLRKDLRVRDFLQQMQDQLIATIPFEHEGYSALMDCFGVGAVLPGMIDWHPLGSDIFSRTVQHRAPNGEVSYLKPRIELSVNFTSNVSMLVDIYEHEHHLNLRVSYDAKIWEEKLIIKLVDTFSDIFAKMLFSKDSTVAELLLGGAVGTTRLKARL
ncbi:MAG: Non-ribosomal peptide synthetase [Alectoria sarmentosa]|nr:MAG: Non-ribosomal peptide synthetase [Alectoria sarmentosa]